MTEFIRNFGLLHAKYDHNYNKINPNEEDFLSEKYENQESFASSRPNHWNRRLLLVSILNVGVLLLNTMIFTTSFSSWRAAIPNINAAIQLTTGYSPILNSVNIKLKSVYLNGTLFPPKNEPWSRKEPGNREAEDIWQSFEPAWVFPITRNDVIQMGKDPETAVRFPDEHFGLGNEAYVAALDVTHKIHCLNELRKMTFAKYPTSDNKSVVFSDNKNHEAYYHRDHHGSLWWYHLRHCVDMLAQDLICHADAHVHTYNFRDTQIHPFPDFSIQRECRDLNQILDYRKQHKVDQDKYVETVRYEEGESKLLPLDKQFYELNGFSGSKLFPNGEGFEEYWAKNWE